MGSVYKCQMDFDVEDVLEELRDKVATVAGVTLTGNRLTMRWYKDDQLVDVHMIIESVTTPAEAAQQSAVSDKIGEFLQKYPECSEELYFLEHGEHSK